MPDCGDGDGVVCDVSPDCECDGQTRCVAVCDALWYVAAVVDYVPQRRDAHGAALSVVFF